MALTWEKFVEKLCGEVNGEGGTSDFSNQNLLHNWDFRNPVNQRAVSGTISTAGYFYDRWVLNSGSVVTNAAYLTIGAAAEIEQRIEGNLLAGETVTVSVMVGGTVFSGTGIMPTSGTASVTLTGWGTATLGYATGYMYIRLSPTAASNVVRVKLEIGTVSTLAYDPPMDYGIELAKCQRYLFLYNGYIAPAADINANACHFMAPMTSTMRVLPSITGTLVVYVPSGEQPGFDFVPWKHGSLVGIRAGKIGHGLTSALLYTNDNVFLSADL